MSLLFEESAPKKTKRKAKLPTSSGLSAKTPAKVGPISIFGDNLFDAPAKPKAVKKSTMPMSASQDFADPLDAFAKEHPEINEYVLLSVVTDCSLSPAQVREKIVESANTNTDYLGEFAQRIVAFLEKTDNEKTKITASMTNEKPRDGASFQLRSFYYLKHNLSLKMYGIMKKHALGFQEVNQLLIRLLALASAHPHKKEVKLNHTLLEQNFRAYRRNKVYQTTKSLRNRVVDLIANYEKPKGLPKTVTGICQKMFSAEIGFFVEQGVAESLFETSVGAGYNVDKRIAIVMNNPEAIGKAILTSANEYLKAQDMAEGLLQIYFILFCRLYFARMYRGELGRRMAEYDYSDFAYRITQLRNLSPIGFGFTENFLEDKYKSMPLYAFPSENPYRWVIGLFEQLPYYICPIDFCHACHTALRELQNIASQISITLQQKATGKIFAKSDHLLCLDDLRDICTIVFLLGNPVPIAGIVMAFEPFIHGLEMPSELEFAFTNISAMVTHILSLNIDDFVREAKQRTEQLMEVDPLLGM